jgi:hypothetical protein
MEELSEKQAAWLGGRIVRLLHLEPILGCGMPGKELYETACGRQSQLGLGLVVAKSYEEAKERE